MLFFLNVFVYNNGMESRLWSCFCSENWERGGRFDARELFREGLGLDGMSTRENLQKNLASLSCAQSAFERKRRLCLCDLMLAPLLMLGGKKGLLESTLMWTWKWPALLTARKKLGVFAFLLLKSNCERFGLNQIYFGVYRDIARAGDATSQCIEKGRFYWEFTLWHFSDMYMSCRGIRIFRIL